MLNTRFVTIRKHFKLTQSEFGQRLGTSRVVKCAMELENEQGAPDEKY